MYTLKVLTHKYNKGISTIQRTLNKYNQKTQAQKRP